MDDLTTRLLREQAEYLAGYFDRIPDEQWMVFHAGSKDGTQRCAWGHLYMEGRQADAVILELLLGPFPGELSDYNNGTSGTKYDTLETPRRRIVAVLRDIAAGYCQPKCLITQKEAR